MTKPISAIHASKVAIASGMALLLGGCFMTPGTFNSELQVLDNGRFAFTYDGEISILGVGQLAEMGAAAKGDEFEAEACYAASGEERDCTAGELATQREEWDANAPSRAEEQAQQAEMVKLMLGEVDLSNPEKVAEFTRKLERQKGWNEVTYREDGVFEVSFAVDGMLTHDFLFPSIEGLPMPGAFVQVYVRDEGMVRVEAPGFSGANSGGAGFSGIGQLMGMASKAAPEEEAAQMPNIPSINGTFRITTNATIMANNTDEGPSMTGTSSVLTWDIDPQSPVSPTALIKIGD